MLRPFGLQRTAILSAQANEKGTNMNRKLKALGLALVALCAFAAVSATGASANSKFTSESGHTELKGSQIGIDKFKTAAGTVECNEATYTGTSASTETTEQTINPTYSECKAFGFVNAVIDMNGCDYLFTIKTEGVPAVQKNSIHIVCPAEKVISVTAFNCEVTVPPQTIENGVTYINSGTGGTGMDIETTVHATGLTYIQHSKSFPGCTTNGGTGGLSTSLYHDGTYDGTATLQGKTTAGAAVGITTS